MTISFGIIRALYDHLLIHDKLVNNIQKLYKQPIQNVFFLEIKSHLQSGLWFVQYTIHKAI